MQKFRENMHIVPVNEVAHLYVIEKVKLRKKGTPVDDFDLLIAVTAIQLYLGNGKYSPYE